MARMTCICGQHMNNNMDIVPFAYDCLSDDLFHKCVEEANKSIDEFFFPEEEPEIWRCPKCQTLYWFEYMNDYAKVFIYKNKHLIQYQNKYICTCGHNFLSKELIHCYSEQESIDILNSIDKTFEQNLPGEFEDSKVHIWKCPDCNRLYWIERDSGIVQCYEKKE